MERVDSVVKKSGKKGGGALEKLLNKFKTVKNIEYIVASVFVLIAIIIMFSGNLFSGNKEDDTLTFTLGEYSAAMESKVGNVLSSIEGAGKVKVMITYESGVEIITAMVVNKQSNSVTDEHSGGYRETVSSTEQNSPVMVGGKPVVLKEIEPKVKGVIVVAEGAKSIKVKLELLKAVSTLLSVSTSNIEIFTMNK